MYSEAGMVSNPVASLQRRMAPLTPRCCVASGGSRADGDALSALVTLLLLGSAPAATLQRDTRARQRWQPRGVTSVPPRGAHLRRSSRRYCALRNR